MNSLRRLHLPAKTTICKLRLGITAFNSSICSSPPQEGLHSLTDEEVRKINLLIPRLCDSNQLPTALRLTTTALLANPPLDSLNLSPLVNSLTSQPDLTHTMSLLTHLLHTPHSHPYISPIALMLLSSYLHSHSSNHALKLFRWLQRKMRKAGHSKFHCGVTNLMSNSLKESQFLVWKGEIWGRG